jgi:hypothetical protein
MVRAAAFLLVAGGAAAETPPRLPLRDVDVTYRVPVPVTQGTAILQRFRWSASLRTQRLDLPTSGTWMLLDYAHHTMTAVRDETREAAVQPAPPEPGGALLPGGRDTVAGLACTEYRAGDGSQICLTADGVLLRVERDGRTVLEAASVRYGPQDASVFAVPAGYTAPGR